MAKRVKFTPKNTKHGWRLNIPPKFSESGKRQQLFYRTQALALKAGADMEEKKDTFGIQARAISASLAEQATAAAALLSPYGIDILEAARIVIGIREREAKSETLADAAAAWAASYEGLREATKRNYNSTIKRLSLTLADHLLATISTKQLQDSLVPTGGKQSVAASHFRNARVFWYYAARKGWCEADVINKVEVPPAPEKQEEILILTTGETEKLLRVAEAHFPQVVASYAVQLFAGIRVDEVARLEDFHIDADGISLPKTVAKKNRRRHITPNATLAAWLKQYPFTPCPNKREVSAACRRLVGWDVVSVILNRRVKAGKMAPLPPPTLGPWPQNALRHSHATYAIASGVRLQDLLFEFGHIGDATLLRENYVGMASKKQAEEYFDIRPDKNSPL